MRRRLWFEGAKSISSEESWSTCVLELVNGLEFSMDCATLSPWRSSWVAAALDCDESCMLSTRSHFRRGFGRGVSCESTLVVCVSCSSSVAFTGASTLGAARGGGMTNRLADVTFFHCVSGVGACSVRSAGFGVWTAKTLRSPDCSFCLGCCAAVARGARKRCGEGVSVGIVAASFMSLLAVGRKSR